jgi:hypothetical protein
MALRIVSWNICRRADAWRVIADDHSIDVALLQEANPPTIATGLEITPSCDEPWLTAGSDRAYRTAVAWRGDRIHGVPRALSCIGDPNRDAICVSRSGTLAAVDVPLDDGKITLVSAYAFWESPRTLKKANWIFADASAHRLISDISGFLDSYRRHRVIVAGDFNILHGYGDHGKAYWKQRYESVFSRFDALGLAFVGPQSPEGGRQAAPWPHELPEDSRNVPTFHSNRQTPATATRQLDFVFASRSIASRIHVRALNSVNEWGPSDHCRIEILAG